MRIHIKLSSCIHVFFKVRWSVKFSVETRWFSWEKGPAKYYLIIITHV